MHSLYELILQIIFPTRHHLPILPEKMGTFRNGSLHLVLDALQAFGGAW